MAQSKSINLSIKYMKTPQGQFSNYTPAVDIIVGLEEYVIIPGGGTDSRLFTQGGFEFLVDNTVAALVTAISSTDATT